MMTNDFCIRGVPVTEICLITLCHCHWMGFYEFEYILTAAHSMF